jgi:hypothetical protein
VYRAGSTTMRRGHCGVSASEARTHTTNHGRPRCRPPACCSELRRCVTLSRRIPAPGLVIRAYRTTGHLPIAAEHALIRPTSGVGTSAHAICALIPTPRGCHCFRR